MFNIDIAKKTLVIAAQLGAGKISHDIIKNNVSTTNVYESVIVGVGSFALGGVVARQAANQMSETIDEVVTAVQSIQTNH